MLPEQYKIFLSQVYRRSDGTFLSARSVNHYAGESIRKINEMLRNIDPDFSSIYEVESFDELLVLRDKLFSNPDFIALNTRGNNMYSAGFNRFVEFAEGSEFLAVGEKIQLMDVREPAPAYRVQKERTVPNRKSLRIHHVEEACNFTCEIDSAHKTFIAEATNRNYVEGHHIIPLQFQKEFECNLDCYANILVLCPTCHRFLHYGLIDERRYAYKRIYDERYPRFEKTGILLDRPSFLEMVTEPRTTE